MQEIEKYVILPLIYLLLAASIFIILQKISPAEKNQKIWRKTESSLDLKFWALGQVLGSLIIPTILTLVVTIFILLFNLNLAQQFQADMKAPISYMEVFLSIILLDFMGYWVHRIYHNKSLWKYHAIHHSPKELEWISSARFHPLESIVAVIILQLSCLVMGFGVKEIALAFVIRSSYGYFVHSNLSWTLGPLGYVIASPYYHRWHHSKNKEAIDKNFAGIFPIWDIIFKTAYMPKNLPPHNLGIKDDIGDNLISHLVYPFKAKKAKNKLSEQKVPLIN